MSLPIESGSKSFQPDSEALQKYADIFVNFALNHGEGVEPGEVVEVNCSDLAKPMLLPLQEAILERGAHMKLEYVPAGITRHFLETASDAQLDFYNKDFLDARASMTDHLIRVIADDPHGLEGVSPEKLVRRSRAMNYLKDAFSQKEREGKFTWTLGLYGIEEMAAEAGMTLDDYWNQIQSACFLDKSDPVGEWKNVFAEVGEIRKKLDALDIGSVHIEAEDVDLSIAFGEERQWIGCSGRNIPSFELFISPDWRGTNGKIHFTEPLYRYGNLIEGVQLEFRDGEVVSASAERGNDLLQQIVSVPNANRIGEFSLTDGRLSPITRFMAHPLYDENRGGRNGNTHIALGRSYQDSYRGDISQMTNEEFESLGFNPSCSEHVDMISTSDRVVTATLKTGKETVIYRDGQFVL